MTSRAPCTCATREAALQELSDDPVIQSLLELDRLKASDMTDVVGAVRKRLIAERWRRVA